MKRFVSLTLSLILLLVLVAGCITVQSPVGHPSVIDNFSGSPSAINSGGSSTLSWNVTGANSVSIDQGIGQVNAAGTLMVSPSASTVYTITANSSAGLVTTSTTIMVTQAELPWITSFTTNTSTIDAGGSSTLQWSTTGATSVSINQNIGSVSLSGTQIVNPTVTTTYTLTAINSFGSVTSTVVVTVRVTNVPWINSFTSSPLTIATGNQATLSWTIAGATSASIFPGIGTVNATSGSQQVSPATTTTYTLTAINAAGSTTWQVTIIVGDIGQPVINSFAVNPTTINAGQSSTLLWNITNATSASINQSINTVNAASGTYTVTPAVTTTYTLTATNGVGSVTATATVTVSGTGVPVINSFTANPATVTSGGASTLSWSVTGATSVSINQGIGIVVPTSGTRTVNPIATTTYTLTATNSNGSVTALVTVTIGTSNLPVIVSLAANPSIISAGQYSHISYIIEGNPTSVTLNQGIGTASQFGVDVNPATTTTYTLTATNSDGSATRTVTITVQ